MSRVQTGNIPRDSLNCATDHYIAIRKGLGEALRAEVYGTIERLTQNPHQFRIVENEIRRCLVQRFPYSVLFRVMSPDLVRILAIRHHRQHEQFGLQRK